MSGSSDKALFLPSSSSSSSLSSSTPNRISFLSNSGNSVHPIPIPLNAVANTNANSTISPDTIENRNQNTNVNGNGTRVVNMNMNIMSEDEFETAPSARKSNNNHSSSSSSNSSSNSSNLIDNNKNNNNLNNLNVISNHNYVSNSDGRAWVTSSKPTINVAAATKYVAEVPPLFSRKQSSLMRDQRQSVFERDGQTSLVPIGTLQANHDTRNSSVVTFNWFIFMEELLIQSLGTLSVFYSYMMYGLHHAANHGFYGPLRATWLNHALWCFSTIVIVLYNVESTPNVSFAEVFIACALYFSRTCIIAAKYAFFAPAFIRTIRTRLLTTSEVTSTLLGVGWLVMDDDVIVREVNYSLERTGIDAHQLYLTFGVDWERNWMPKQQLLDIVDQVLPTTLTNITMQEIDTRNGVQVQVQVPVHTSERESSSSSSSSSDSGVGNVNQSLGEEWKEQLEHGSVNMRLFVVHLIKDSVRNISFPHGLRIGMSLGFLHALIPIIVRLMQGRPLFGSSLAETTIILMCILFNTWNFGANWIFVVVGFIDYSRRIFVMHQLSAMLSSRYKEWITKDASFVPLLAFDSPANIAHWFDMRVIFQDYGKQFFYRIQAYCSFWVLCVVALVAYAVFQVFLAKTPELTSLVFTGFELFTVVGAILFMANAASSLNNEHTLHHSLLLRKRTAIQRALSLSEYSSPSELASLLAARDMVTAVHQLAEAEDRLNPVKILGFDATDNMFRALLGVAGSGALAVAKLLWF